MKFFKVLILVLFVFTTLFSTVKANESTMNKVESHKPFNPKDFIFNHILDAYEWHIVTLGEKEVSIPLPIIVFSKTTGLHLFFSSEFHHGEKEYEGFKIAHGGKYNGKIVEIDATGSEIRPVDLSITKNVTSLFVGIALILFIFLSISKRYKEDFARSPKGIQSWIEPLVIFVRDDIAKSTIGEEKYLKYLPYLLTIFFFILINNLLGMFPIFPGGANLTGNVTITMVLALFTFIITSFSGTKEYWRHIIDMPGVPWWLKFPIPLMPFVEVMGVFLKPFVLTVRLFANITAGHIIALSFYSLIFVFGQKNIFAGYGVSVVSIVFIIFMGLIELLVCFIQAYVFTLLSAIYFKMALEKPEHEAAH